MSTIILIITNMTQVNITATSTTGISKSSKALTVTAPNPLKLNTFSTKNAPAISDANQPDIQVIIGFNAFFRTCRYVMLDSANPLALAVLTYGILRLSSIADLVS